jgi:hypothetical protein
VQHEIPFGDDDVAMLVHRDARQGRGRLPLRAGHEEQGALRRCAHRGVRRDHDPGGETEKPEAQGDVGVELHRRARDRHLAAATLGDVDHLLEPMDVGRKGRDQDASRCGGDDPLEARPDGSLARGESGKLGVGAVGQEGQNPLFAQPREPAQVGPRAGQRIRVELEVGRVNDPPDRRLDDEHRRLRDRVRHGQRLDPKRADRQRRAALGEGEEARRGVERVLG